MTLGCKAPMHDFDSAVAHLAGPLGMPQYAAYRLAPCSRVSGRNQKARQAVVYYLGGPTDICGNHGSFDGHRLYYRAPKRLLSRGYEENIGLSHDLGHIIALAGELDSIDEAQPLDEPTQLH